MDKEMLKTLSEIRESAYLNFLEWLDWAIEVIIEGNEDIIYRSLDETCKLQMDLDDWRKILAEYIYSKEQLKIAINKEAK